jgi:hypothetical protein
LNSVGANLSAIWREDGKSALDDFESPVFITSKPVGNQLEVVCASHQDQILAWSECDMWRQTKRLRRAVRLFGVQAEGQLPIGLDIQWNHRLGEKSVIVPPAVPHPFRGDVGTIRLKITLAYEACAESLKRKCHGALASLSMFRQQREVDLRRPFRERAVGHRISADGGRNNAAER